jgi:hypothetical protein
MTASEIFEPAGHPSTLAPMHGPWLDPKMPILNRTPNSFIS